MIKRIDTHRVLTTLLALFLAAAPAQAASFDCTKAATRAEKTICADPGYIRDKNPPEVDALIGMRIPPRAPGKQGNIPGWVSRTSRSFHHGTKPLDTLSGIEEIYRPNMVALIVDKLEKKNLERVILDAQVLPMELMPYRIRRGELVWKNNWHKYYGINVCEKEGEAYIVGLMRPETGKKDCNHETHQVKRAWRVEKNTGHIEEISPRSVHCYFDLAEDDCTN